VLRTRFTVELTSPLGPSGVGQGATELGARDLEACAWPRFTMAASREIRALTLRLPITHGCN
jgi:hypothetical protein